MSERITIETLRHDLETANNTIDKLNIENKELKDRIDELSSKESSQRTAIEKAIAWIKHPLTGFSEMDVDTIELLKILEGQGLASSQPEGTKKEEEK